MQLMPALKQPGVVPVKVDIDVEELAAWCRQQGRPMDGGTRSKFVVEKVPKGEYIKD